MEQKPIPPEGTPDKLEAKTDMVAFSLARWERKRQEALSFDFAALGYGPDQLAANGRFRGDYEALVRDSGGDPDKALEALEQRGIKVIRNSKLLAGQQLMNLLGANSEKFGAMFGTPANVEKLIEQHANGSAALRAELESARGAKGVVFLDREPRAKSVFHEAAHAVQELNGLDMDAADPIKRLYRELEANTALITLHEAGLLTGITKGSYKSVKAPFGGHTAKVDPNDIYAEALYFAGNEEKLECLQQDQRKVLEDAEANKLRDDLSGHGS